MLEMKYNKKCVKDLKKNPGKYHLQTEYFIVHPIHPSCQMMQYSLIIFTCVSSGVYLYIHTAGNKLVKVWEKRVYFLKVHMVKNAEGKKLTKAFLTKRD